MKVSIPFLLLFGLSTILAEEPTFKDKALSYWVQRTVDKDFEVEWEAKKAVKAIGDKATPYLRTLLKSEKAEERLRAATSFGEVPLNKEAAEDLAAALSDKDEKVRCFSAVALSKWKERSKDAMPVLIALLENTDKSLRLAALSSIGRYQAEAKDAIPALVKLKAHVTTDEQVVITGTIGKMGADNPEVLRLLCEDLKHEDASIRALAADFLGSNAKSSSAAIPALKEAVAREQRKLVLESMQNALKQIEEAVKNGDSKSESKPKKE